MDNVMNKLRKFRTVENLNRSWYKYLTNNKRNVCRGVDYPLVSHCCLPTRLIKITTFFWEVS